jgi:hypothetical protein
MGSHRSARTSPANTASASRSISSTSAGSMARRGGSAFSTAGWAGRCRARATILGVRDSLGLLVLTALLSAPPGCGGADEAACRTDADCPDSSYCPFIVCKTGCAGTCPEKICRERAGPGADCGPSLDRNHSCLDGLVCNTAVGLTCTPPQPIGGPCAVESDCAGSDDPAGPYCAVERATQVGVCAPAGELGQGEPCPVERACGPDLTCGDVCLPALAEGQACPDAPDSCADGLTCRDGVCVR